MKPIFYFWLRSRFIREEILKWALTFVFATWAVVASSVALMKQDRVILVGVSDDSTYLIQGTNEHSKRKEVSSFIRNFIANYYSFSPANHAEQMGRAGDLMEKGLWDQKRESLLKINERLKVEPLIQKAEILSIDLLASDHAEAVVALTIFQKIEKVEAKLKVSIKFRDRSRTESNPWPFAITEVSDATL